MREEKQAANLNGSLIDSFTPKKGELDRGNLHFFKTKSVTITQKILIFKN